MLHHPDGSCKAPLDKKRLLFVYQAMGIDVWVFHMGIDMGFSTAQHVPNNNFQVLVSTLETEITALDSFLHLKVKQLKRLQQLQPIFGQDFCLDVTFQSSSDEYIFKAAPSHACGSGSSASEKKSNINSSISSSAAMAAASLCLPGGLGGFCTNN